MCDLTVGVFENLDITYPVDVYKIVAYMQLILRESALKNYREVLTECKKSERELTGDKWDLGELKGLPTDDLWAWANKDGILYYGHAYLGLDKFVDFKRELWFELGKCMWIKYRSVYQDHLKYVHNDIVNPFRFRILRYVECVREMHELSKYLPPP